MLRFYWQEGIFLQMNNSQFAIPVGINVVKTAEIFRQYLKK